MTLSRPAHRLSLVPILLPFVFVDGALAQQREPDPNVTVLERPRPEYDPIGGRVGAFRVLPEIAFTGAYSDNINFDEEDEDSDYVAILRPSIGLDSDWSRHALGVEVGAEFARHRDEDDEDYEDFFLNGDGNLEISRQTQLNANAGVNFGHEGADEVNNDGVEEFKAVDGGLALSQELNRVTLTLGGDVERVVFDDNDQDDEDRYEYNAALRAAYEVSPRLDVFGEGRYNILRYDNLQDVTNDDQDSDGYEGRVGVGVDLTSVLFGEAFAGYRVQQFDDDDSKETGLSLGIDMNWNVTQLTSVGFTGQRDFEPSNQAGANSNFQTEVGVDVTHELRRNLVVGGSVSYVNDNFRGDGREDDTYRFGALATYWVNRNASINAGYDYSQRESNEDGEDFEANEVSIGLTLRF